MREKLNYLFSKINWASSFLDGKAVEIMNSLPNDIEVLQAKNKEYEGTIEILMKALNDANATILTMSHVNTNFEEPI
jgi:uncharacterized protein involved in exopolysaccharide biosynthesis